MSKPEGVPAIAEELPVLNFYRAHDESSKLVPNVKQRTFKLHCPRCDAVLKSHFDVNECDCGLSVKMTIGGLFIWATPKLAAVS